MRRLTLIGVLCIVFAGCGNPDFLATYPASGTATFQGKPMVHARVMLHPVGGDELLQKTRPHGTVGEDGSFILGTYRADDGAPEGTYKVTVIWPNAPETETEKPGFILDQLQGRFNNVQNSTIEVTITSGDNTLPPIAL